MTHLKFVKCISQKNLRHNNLLLTVWSVYSIATDELLLACGSSGLRAVSLHTGELIAHEPTAALRDDVRKMAFDAHTDTLILFVRAAYGWQLVSLRRNASQWLEVQRLNTSIPDNPNNLFFVDVCGSRVLLGGRGGNTLYVFDVGANHSLREAGTVTLALQTILKGLACTRRDNDTLVAYSHGTSVYLQRLDSLPLRVLPLANVNLTYPSELLFRGELLLVEDWKQAVKKDDIYLFRVTRNALIEGRVLLDTQSPVSVAVYDWTFAGDRLVVAEWKEVNRGALGDVWDLHVYDFV